MSFNINTTTSNNTSPLLQSAISSLGNYNITTTPHTNSTISVPFAGSNISPVFKMEMYKSENGGFVLNLLKYNSNTYSENGKLFILNDIENLGRDIQYILAMEILKK